MHRSSTNWSLNDDIIGEVLCRLPGKRLVSCKRVSKTWKSLISSPSILRAHFERSQHPSAIFVEQYDRGNFSLTFVNLDKKNTIKSLYFLPQEVDLVGSSNGLLCCTSSCNRFLYICNPLSEEWVAIILRPERSTVTNTNIGFAFYPFGSSLLNPNPCFKLVCLHRTKLGNNYNNDPNNYVYSFWVYTSETGEWRRSKDVCPRGNFRIRKNNVIFVRNRFHWLTGEHHIITFDVETELSSVIKLPGRVMQLNDLDMGRGGICLGASSGFLHYVCSHPSEIRVWELKDYGEISDEWVLKYNLNLNIDLVMEIKERFGLGCHVLEKFDELVKVEDETVANYLFSSLAYSEEVVFMKVDTVVFSYDFRSRELKERYYLVQFHGVPLTDPTVIPYTICLAAAGVLKEIKNGKEIVNSSTEQEPKRRKYI
ncbi:hypothetical protein CCACVL1_27692 [Corchorus capsularis]|uniref:F-box domain-containing protein n=1 Tax=Corchorus capsularis TaxID=210143 RepID=A0A1R3G985_COCAP|nr:hypothetical protein CCACVL1_27692 [Corchorus capsularis]